MPVRDTHLTRDLYAVLNLPSPASTSHSTGPPLSTAEIKSAYRAALLRCHPDKHTPQTSYLESASEAVYTIDEVIEAYQTLASPEKRREYDRALVLAAKRRKDQKGLPGGVAPAPEAIDLDDLPYDENCEVWYRSCRCGAERGYLFTEKELEAEIEAGELLVGCSGCSLWIKVLFGITIDD